VLLYDRRYVRLPTRYLAQYCRLAREDRDANSHRKTGTNAVASETSKAARWPTKAEESPSAAMAKPDNVAERMTDSQCSNLGGSLYWSVSLLCSLPKRRLGGLTRP